MQFPRINDSACQEPTSVDSLILKPGYAIVQIGHTLTLAAYLAGYTSEALLNSGLTFSSSNPAVATVDASGLVTAVAAGTALISVTSNALTDYALIVVAAVISPATTACGSIPVGTVFVVDRSLSMLTAYDAQWPNYLAVAKELARAVVNAVSITKDSLGLVSFDADPQTVNALGDTKANLLASIAGLAVPVAAEDDFTDIAAALTYGIARVRECITCQQKAILLITDGIGAPAMSDQDRLDVIERATTFKESGGVVVVVGIKAVNRVYTFLRNLASPGYFVNASGTVADAKTALLTLPGLYCSGVA